MDSNTKPAGEVAAIDAVFEQAPISPAVEAPPIPDVIPLPGAERPRPAPAAPTAPLRDYLREIQQEYTAQQEEGKL